MSDNLLQAISDLGKNLQRGESVHLNNGLDLLKANLQYFEICEQQRVLPKYQELCLQTGMLRISMLEDLKTLLQKLIKSYQESEFYDYQQHRTLSRLLFLIHKYSLEHLRE